MLGILFVDFVFRILKSRKQNRIKNVLDMMIKQSLEEINKDIEKEIGKANKAIKKYEPVKIKRTPGRPRKNKEV